MAGSKSGGAKTAATIRAKHGKDYYQKIGKLGGAAYHSKPVGFAAMDKEKVSAAGKRGAQTRWGKTSQHGRLDKKLESMGYEEIPMGDINIERSNWLNRLWRRK